MIAVHLAPVFWRAQFLGTVSIFRDITHEVQVDRMKSEFVANVSHELRTPMTSIKGYVEIMLMGASGEIEPPAAPFPRDREEQHRTAGRAGQRSAGHFAHRVRAG